MYTEKGSFGISISHLWTDYWIDFVAWPMISFCSDEPGVTAHICIRSYKTGRSLPHMCIHIKANEEITCLGKMAITKCGGGPLSVIRVLDVRDIKYQCSSIQFTLRMV